MMAFKKKHYINSNVMSKKLLMINLLECDRGTVEEKFSCIRDISHLVKVMKKIFILI